MKKDPLIYKVSPVAGKIPPADGDWDLIKYQHWAEAGKALAAKYGNRKVLLVKYAFPPRDKNPKNIKSRLLEGDGKYRGSGTKPDQDWFFIDVPKHFFSIAGDFIASPPYDEKDILQVKWTGWGRHSGWIDMNIQQRGAGGTATSADPAEVVCAKWS